MVAFTRVWMQIAPQHSVSSTKYSSHCAHKRTIWRKNLQVSLIDSPSFWIKIVIKINIMQDHSPHITVIFCLWAIREKTKINNYLLLMWGWILFLFLLQRTILLQKLQESHWKLERCWTCCNLCVLCSHLAFVSHLLCNVVNTLLLLLLMWTSCAVLLCNDGISKNLRI